MTHRRVSRLFGTGFASLLAGGLALAAVPAQSHAEQFLLFDVMFKFTKMDADNATPSKSHFYVRNAMLNPARPVNWTAPIDYRNGTVHVRAEIIDKPAGSANTRWTLCYIPNRGIGSGYGCANTAAYTEKGIWEIDTGMTTWWQNDQIDWSQGIKQMDLVLKDSMGKFAHTLPAELFFPTTVRITMVQVSKGATYDPSKVPNLPPAMIPDGGATPDGGAADASGSDDGGASASGGTTGSGGAAGGDGSGGAAGTPGGSGTGGTVAPGTGGAAGSTTPGSGGSGPGSGAVTGGGCAIPGPVSTGSTAVLILGASLLLASRRRSRRR